MTQSISEMKKRIESEPGLYWEPPVGARKDLPLIGRFGECRLVMDEMQIYIWTCDVWCRFESRTS